MMLGTPDQVSLVVISPALDQSCRRLPAARLKGALSGVTRSSSPSTPRGRRFFRGRRAVLTKSVASPWNHLVTDFVRQLVTMARIPSWCWKRTGEPACGDRAKALVPLRVNGTPRRGRAVAIDQRRPQ